VNNRLFVKKMVKKDNVEYFHFSNIIGCIKTEKGYISSSGCKMFLSKEKGKKVYYTQYSLLFHNISIVDHCVICGSKDMSIPAVHPHTGDICDHPYKLQ